ncbi:Lipase [Aphelenchoides besseyi]|nr:Lipase [Aphelenchoides besseyi]
MFGSILWLSIFCSVGYAQTFRNFIVNPEAEMTVPQIIRYWGYPVEVHHTTTRDGYILELHRIPHGRHETGNVLTNKPVVFLQHGLLCTSSVFVLNLPHQSLGFMLADAGFDVWLGNNRGNSYSNGHKNTKITRSEYWKFSWDQMAKYDLPAMIDYALNYTQQSQLYYVGHSQGTLIMYSKLSLADGFGKKIKKFFALAPVSTLKNVRGLFKHLGERSYEQLLLFTALFGDQEFLPSTILTRWLTELVCTSTNQVCENFLFLTSGPDTQQMNKTRIPIYLAHSPSGTSIRNVLHYCQMIRNKEYQQLAFDYGKSENLKAYGMVVPYDYDISKITGVQMYLYYSTKDWLATPEDIEQFLLKKLPRSWTVEVNKLDNYNHNDFLWAISAPEKIYRPIIDIILNDQPQLRATLRSPTKPPVRLASNGSRIHKPTEDDDLLRNVEDNEMPFKVATTQDYVEIQRPTQDDDLLDSRLKHLMSWKSAIFVGVLAFGVFSGYELWKPKSLKLYLEAKDRKFREEGNVGGIEPATIKE